MKETVILAVFVLMGIILGLNVIRSFKQTGEFFGRPSIHPVLFYLGKVANISIWTIFIFHLSFENFAWMPVPVFSEYVGFILFISGSAFVILSFVSLGENMRFGLSDMLLLKTGGIYRVSRNPMYVGFFLLDMAAIMFTFNPVLVFLLIVAALIHHRIVLSEEKYIQNRFGEEWNEYSLRVRRYL